MTSDFFDGYLRRLGAADLGLGAPSAEGLFALQRAHLERIAYENIDIQLGRPPGIDPELSVRRFAEGRGGYCFHLNGAFALLLESLGYEVTRHVGAVSADAASRAVRGDHLALTVRVGGAEYWVDAGLGDMGPYEPLPLIAGPYEQNGFTYSLERLDPLEGEGPGWSFFASSGGARRMNFRDAPAATADFEGMHAWLSTNEESPFVRVFAVFRRDAGGTDGLRGKVLTRLEGGKQTDERVLSGPEELLAVLGGLFGLDLGDLTPADRAALWARVERVHEVWSAQRRAAAQPVRD
ncbi:arylamine N-acetyltransferase [Streptomyces erythrochromogenes]|uniref:arylamine N-acetyltransferase family protein n=1 Tax=Streptomyces erythrochromogenes TaxID=285574 RepID=UPI003679F8FB